MESSQPIKRLKDKKKKKKNPFGHTVALGLTEPLKEINSRNISWGVKVYDLHKADNLTTSMC